MNFKNIASILLCLTTASVFTAPAPKECEKDNIMGEIKKMQQKEDDMQREIDNWKDYAYFIHQKVIELEKVVNNK